MSRIPESEIEQLKQSVSLQRLAASAGVKLRKKGADLVGRCPFHADKTPSLVITSATNLWHCLGACAAGGSVIDWVMRAERCSFREAVARLRTSTLFAEAPSAPAPARPAARGALADAERLQWVADFYHQTLKGDGGEAARAYLQRRGIDGSEAVEHFKLGYANRTLGYELPSNQVKTGKLQRGQLQRLGVMRKSGHEHLCGSLVIPLFGERGEVVQLYGRKVTPNLRTGTALHLYLPGPMRGVFNREALKEPRRTSSCASRLIDAITFWCAGLRNVTACFGVNGFTDELREALSAKRIKRITIAFDRDEAGDRAAAEAHRRGAHRTRQVGIDRALPARDGRECVRAKGKARSRRAWRSSSTAPNGWAAASATLRRSAVKEADNAQAAAEGATGARGCSRSAEALLSLLEARSVEPLP